MMDAAARGYPPGSLRVSDADRDRAVAELSAHYQAGRLTIEEFDERSGRALRARTGAELAELLTDLPRQHDSGPVTPPGGATPRLPARPVLRVTAALALAAVIGVTAGSTGHHGLFALVPVLMLAAFARRLSRGRRVRSQ